jgi:hypothetical protein
MKVCSVSWSENPTRRVKTTDTKNRFCLIEDDAMWRSAIVLFVNVQPDAETGCDTHLASSPSHALGMVHCRAWGHDSPLS